MQKEHWLKDHRNRIANLYHTYLPLRSKQQQKKTKQRASIFYLKPQNIFLVMVLHDSETVFNKYENLFLNLV